MTRLFSICVFACCILSQAPAQSAATSTINGYNESQKRLLARDVGRFFYVLNQGQWDLDSCIAYACKIYRLNIQLPYDESIEHDGLERELTWLNGRRVNEVLQSIHQAAGEKEIALLLELALYYLHRPGTNPSDLENAAVYIAQAKESAQHAKPAKWLVECDALMGELYFQKGDTKKSSAIFGDIAGRLKNSGDKKRSAIAYEQLALHLPFNDKNRLRNLEISFAIFQQMKLNEHAIEVSGDILTYYFSFDWPRAEEQLNNLLTLEKASGFRHLMLSYYLRAYMKLNKADYIGSILDMDSCVAVMTNTGDSSLYSRACLRMGNVYGSLDEYDKAYAWYLKGIEKRGTEPQIFWYPNLAEIYFPMTNLNKAEEFLSLIRRMMPKYPPESKIDSMAIAVRLGAAYTQLQRYDSAEKCFQSFIAYAENIAPEHQQILNVFGFQRYAWLCFHKGNYQLAREYVEKSMKYARGRRSVLNSLELYELRYSIDSAEGKFRDAFFNLKTYLDYTYSFMNMTQRFKSQEANIRYASEKKDQDIRILKQQGLIQEGDLNQARQSRDLILYGSVLLLVIVALGYNQYRMKQKNLQLIAEKNAELRQLVSEKEWLLKEVHHRVKNNLQTIVSLLESQASFLSDEALAAVQISQSRIFATALLHQKLYQFENVSSVNIRDYIPELIQNLREAFCVSQEIDIKMNLHDVELDASQAMPVGMIVNEAFTNAIKYAFKDKTKSAEIIISFSREEDGFVNLLVADNGSGFVTESEHHFERLGLELIKGLALEIGGHADIQSDSQGTRINIRFKLRSPLPALPAPDNRS